MKRKTLQLEMKFSTPEKIIIDGGILKTKTFILSFGGKT